MLHPQEIAKSLMIIVNELYSSCKKNGGGGVSKTKISIKVLLIFLFFTEQLTPDNNGFLSSSAGVIKLDENTSSLTIKSTNFSSFYYNNFHMSAYWYLTSPPGTNVVVNYHMLETGGSLDVYNVVGTSLLRISSFYNTVPAPGHTVFSGNEARFSFHTHGDNVEGVIYTLSVTGS